MIKCWTSLTFYLFFATCLINSIKHEHSCKILYLIHLKLKIDQCPKCYCIKLGNFRENFIFTNSIKRHIWDVRNSRLGHDIPISVNDRVILPFREGLISRNFAYAKFRKNKTLAKIFDFTVLDLSSTRL